MKILHIGAVDRSGGAGISAWRLHQALRAHGANSRLLVQRKSSTDESVVTFVEPSPIDAAASRHIETIQHVYRDRNRTEISNTYFSLPLLGYDLSGHPAVREADLLHLHWVASFQTPRTIGALQALGKPVVWTLHDAEPFTGGCHFPAGCREFRESCSVCPQLRSDSFGVPSAVLSDKKALWRASEFALVAPSRWMAAMASESSLFQPGASVSVIPNAIDTLIFRPTPKSEARSALGIPVEGTYILCGADQSREKRKGFDALARVLDRCRRDRRFAAAKASVLSAGEDGAAWPVGDLPVRSLGRLTSEERMALAYAAADLYLLGSSEDNLPNMMLEALSCGTPVVAFAAGGIPEVIQDGVHGRLVPLQDEASMAEAILSLLSDERAREAMGQEGRRSIEDRYSNRVVAERHIGLYRGALEARGARTAAEPADSKSAVSTEEVAVSAAPGPALEAILPSLTLYCLTEEAASLRQRLEASESDRQAQLTVIQELTAALADRTAVMESLEGESAARLRLLEEQEAQRQNREADVAKQIQLLENELEARLRLLNEQETQRQKREADVAKQIQLLEGELEARLRLLNEQETQRQNREADVAKQIQLLEGELEARLRLLEEQDQQLRARRGWAGG